MIIDRFEGEFAVIETENDMINVSREFLPADAREGDVVILNNGRYEINKDYSADLRNSVRERLHGLLTQNDDQ